MHQLFAVLLLLVLFPVPCATRNHSVVPAEKMCTCILDLAFVVDASGSIEPYWPDVRRFVAGVVGLVNVSPTGSHVGLRKFGADSNIVFGFNEGQDKTTVINRVLSLSGPVPFANTQIHKGLYDANDKLFNEVTNSYGYRPESSVRKVVLIVTDGVQTPPGNPFIPADKLKARDFEIYSVGAGQARYHFRQLERLKNRDIFFVPDPTELPSLINKVAQSICPIAIDGSWSEWSIWSVCTKTISGIQTRTRECANPEPALGGKHCNGTRAVVRECSNMSSCHEAFPLRFQVGKNPSLGVMEIYQNSSWQKLCTSSWDKDEENLTCNAMGYSNDGVYDNGKWHTDKNNTSSTSIHYNCAALTKCENNINNKVQLCKARFTENIQPHETLIAYMPGIIRCSAEGTPNPWIIWSRKDGTLLDKERFRQLSNGSLNVNPVRPGDKGTYVCTIKQNKGPNAVASKDKDIEILVIIRPMIELLRPDKALQEGDSTNLTCKIVKGLPEPQLSWLKNGTELEIKNKTLLLTDVTDEDEGNYACRLENDAGFVTLSTYVTVEIPPKLNPELRNHSVPLNSTLSMKCIVRGDHPLKVNWTKNGVDLGSNNSNTLIVDYVTFKHAGLYGCTAANQAGNTGIMFWIDVTVSPQIYVPPRNKSVPEGYPANFTCKATGIPEPKLSWKFNDGDLPSGISQTNLSEGSLLELSNTTKDMEGSYMCTATNKADATTSSASLHVFEKPSAEVSPNPYPTLVAGDELRLTCKVSEATVKIEWKKNGDPVVSPRAQIETQVDDKLSKLVITEVVEGDSGEYSCEARNSPGIVARSTVKINVKGSITARPALEWYYIVGPMSGCIVIFAIGWYICKRRRAVLIKTKQLRCSC